MFSFVFEDALVGANDSSGVVGDLVVGCPAYGLLVERSSDWLTAAAPDDEPSGAGVGQRAGFNDFYDGWRQVGERDLIDLGRSEMPDDIASWPEVSTVLAVVFEKGCSGCFC